MKSVSFPPIIDNKSRVLVLGSMPGKESLLRKEYYAHPRNYFWPIMHKLFRVGSLDTQYADRVKKLKERGIAVWDVINYCYREGSLDSDILPSSIKLNNFQFLLDKYPKIQTIFFNGQKAKDLFCKNIAPSLSSNIKLHALPSTSPANASLSLKDKLAAWSIISKNLATQKSNF